MNQFLAYWPLYSSSHLHPSPPLNLKSPYVVDVTAAAFPTFSHSFIRQTKVTKTFEFHSFLPKNPNFFPIINLKKIPMSVYPDVKIRTYLVADELLRFFLECQRLDFVAA